MIVSAVIEIAVMLRGTALAAATSLTSLAGN
jgi:hypothetical protein